MSIIDILDDIRSEDSIERRSVELNEFRKREEDLQNLIDRCENRLSFLEAENEMENDEYRRISEVKFIRNSFSLNLF